MISLMFSDNSNSPRVMSWICRKTQTDVHIDMNQVENFTFLVCTDFGIHNQEGVCVFMT